MIDDRWACSSYPNVCKIAVPYNESTYRATNGLHVFYLSLLALKSAIHRLVGA